MKDSVRDSCCVFACCRLCPRMRGDQAAEILLFGVTGVLDSDCVPVGVVGAVVLLFAGVEEGLAIVVFAVVSGAEESVGVVGAVVFLFAV